MAEWAAAASGKYELSTQFLTSPMPRVFVATQQAKYAHTSVTTINSILTDHLDRQRFGLSRSLGIVG